MLFKILYLIYHLQTCCFNSDSSVFYKDWYINPNVQIEAFIIWYDSVLETYCICFAVHLVSHDSLKWFKPCLVVIKVHLVRGFFGVWMTFFHFVVDWLSFRIFSGSASYSFESQKVVVVCTIQPPVTHGGKFF